MNAISLFSGVGGFDLGFERAGIRTVLQAERDPHCLEVLARHWPQTERVTDVRDVGLSCERLWRANGARVGAAASSVGRPPVESGVGSVDLIYGGFPCQDLSVAGKRAGLGGSRSGEWFEFERVLRELRPRWTVIENVPGLLSSNEGRDFAVILHALDELRFAVGWAVLDSQHFGVAQRRRRVFVVAGPARRGVEQVLSLCESCGGNPASGRAAGEDVAGTLGSGSADSQRGYRNDLDSSGGFVAYTIQQNDGGQHKRADRPGGGMYVKQADQALTVGSTDVTVVASAVSASAGHHGHSSPRGDGSDNLAVVGALSDGAHHCGGLNGQDAYTGRIFPAQHGVRRLTPLECERLQGFPDDWTRYTADGGEIADSHRYRMMGNAVTVTVAEWLGHRLMAVDAL